MLCKKSDFHPLYPCPLLPRRRNDMRLPLGVVGAYGKSSCPPSFYLEAAKRRQLPLPPSTVVGHKSSYLLPVSFLAVALGIALLPSRPGAKKICSRLVYSSSPLLRSLRLASSTCFPATGAGRKNNLVVSPKAALTALPFGIGRPPPQP